jgi:hypothetical protein
LKGLADAGLGATSVLANLHYRRIVPLMERELRIYEMSETSNPVSLARSRLVHDRFPLEYAATRARRAISLKAVMHSNDDLWSFVMLPDAPPVSRLPLFLYPSATRRRDSDISLFPAEGGRERRAVRPAHTLSPSARAAQRREQERAARKKERRIRRREHREQRDEEFWLLEQQGLSTPVTSVYLSSGEGEEEESDGGPAPFERWEPVLPSPRAAEAAEEQAPGAGAEVPTTRRSTEGAVRATEAQARTVEASGSAAVATAAATTAPVEPSRKRKRGLSTLR